MSLAHPPVHVFFPPFRIPIDFFHIVSYKHCGPKINTRCPRYCRGGGSVWFMIVSHSYLIKPVSSENVTNLLTIILAFSHHQLILHIHMSQTERIICLCLEHSSYMTRYEKSQWEFWMGEKKHEPGRMGKWHQTSLLYRPVNISKTRA